MAGPPPILLALAAAGVGALVIAKKSSAANAPPRMPALPVATTTAGSSDPNTLPVTTITGNPSNVPPWAASMTVPDVSGTAIPASYATPGSPETSAVQTAINAWASQVGYPGKGEIPLTVDGTYGANTQQAVASFQMWVNSTGQGSLSIDGLAGPQTQAILGEFGSMASGGY